MAPADLLNVISAILGVTAAANDNFFDLGGDSLAALEVIAACREQFNLEIDPLTFLEADSLGAFLDTELEG